MKAGFSQIDITPAGPVLLTGYGGNDRVSESCSQRIYARCAAFENPDGTRSSIIALDLCGLGMGSVERVEADVRQQHGIAPANLVINCSHNHSAPAIDGALDLYHVRTPEFLQTVRAYTAHVEEACSKAVAEALAALEPASLHFSQGLCGFAVNRRRSRPRCRHLPGPVDHDVPVLVVESVNGSRLLGTLFGYACHTTSLCGKDLNGDYSGWACAQIEREVHAPALFLAGCGGDINPLPRYTMERSKAQGFLLAEAVLDAIKDSQRLVTGGIEASLAALSLPLEPAPGIEHWERLASLAPGSVQQRGAQLLMERLQSGKPIETSVPYRVRRWQLEGLIMFFLSGETVVDYSLKLKELHGWECTWVTAYCDQLTPYVPSERVLSEGGYEGVTSMLEYGYPSSFLPGLEAMILRAASVGLRS
jgi:hypothetical protein